MRRLLACLIGVAAVGITAAACGTGSTTPRPRASAATPSVQPATAGPAAAGSHAMASDGHARAHPGAIVGVRRIPGLGTVLAGSDGRTLYLFKADSRGRSACSGACAKAWPPFTVTGPARAAAGVDEAKLGMIRRPGGAMQVAYDGHPLYFFAGDPMPGQARGEGSKAFGASWYVVAPSGKKIDKD